ncbi:hypothetical protein HELA111659_01640 [Helicobacter labetoulli]
MRGEYAEKKLLKLKFFELCPSLYWEYIFIKEIILLYVSYT